jgi:hypothetical protein
MKQFFYLLIFTYLLQACSQSHPENTLVQEQPITKSYQKISDVAMDSSYRAWADFSKDSFPPLALHFMEIETLSISSGPNCWLHFPYKIDGNQLIVYWDKNIEVKYDHDIVKVINKIDNIYIGKPFMSLELINDTTLKATYLIPDLIKTVNYDFIYFADRFTITEFYL